MTKFKREVKDSSSDAGCKEECIDFVFFHEPKPSPCVQPGCRLPRQSKQRSKTEEDLREKKRKGRLGQTQGVGGRCAAFNPLGTRGAGKVQLNRQSSQ